TYLYLIWSGFEIRPNEYLLLFPVYILIMALIGLGAGMMISALTTKYRDFTVLLGFATSLLVYISAVPYPLAEVKEKMPDFAWVVEYNPLTYVIEGFRYMILDTGTFTWGGFLYSLSVAVGL